MNLIEHKKRLRAILTQEVNENVVLDFWNLVRFAWAMVTAKIVVCEIKRLPANTENAGNKSSSLGKR